MTPPRQLLGIKRIRPLDGFIEIEKTSFAFQTIKNNFSRFRYSNSSLRKDILIKVTLLQNQSPTLGLKGAWVSQDSGEHLQSQDLYLEKQELLRLHTSP